MCTRPVSTGTREKLNLQLQMASTRLNKAVRVGANQHSTFPSLVSAGPSRELNLHTHSAVRLNHPPPGINSGKWHKVESFQSTLQHHSGGESEPSTSFLLGKHLPSGSSSYTSHSEAPKWYKLVPTFCQEDVSEDKGEAELTSHQSAPRQYDSVFYFCQNGRL